MPQHREIVQFSFWKPEPLPPKGPRILPVELLPLGDLAAVLEKLFEIPHIYKDPAGALEKPPAAFLHWQVDEGVVLLVRVEEGPPKPGEVLTINARSSTALKTFFRLYIQIFEQFGATVLDERVHEFVTPREFRARLAS
jgi:hypothetical protein